MGITTKLEHKMKLKSLLKGVISQLLFFTIIPLNIEQSIEDIASYSYIAPIFIGFLAGVVDFGFYKLFWILIGEPSRYLLIAVVEVFRGFNHLDGLLDFGDALMIKGDRNAKLRALKDVNIGTGGLGFLLIYVSIFLVAIALLPPPNLFSFMALLVAEISSRDLGLLLLSTIKPIPESNLGKLFHEKLSSKKFALALQSIILILEPFNIILFLILYLSFRSISLHELNGSSGDLAGFAITLSFPILLIGGELPYSSLLHYI